MNACGGTVMAWMNECKKCKREVNTGETCSLCGGKLAKTNERLSFWMYRIPVREWFAWNLVLRVALPVLVLVAGFTLALEGGMSGEKGIQALFLQGFLWMLLGVLGAMLLAMLIVLIVQGKEIVRYTLDKTGIHACTYLERETALKRCAHFVTAAAVERLQSGGKAVDGLVLVKAVEIPWVSIKRVRFWNENRQILFFRPTWWQVLVITCPPIEYTEAEAYIRKKLGRNKAVSIVPSSKAS